MTADATTDDDSTADDGPSSSFADLALRPELQKVLDSLGYEEPTPIQREAIPPILAGRDLLGQAATGTGKTAAFALPILQRLPGGSKRPFALILVPTRELAIQVSEAVHRYGRGLGARVLPIYGGQPIGRQIRTLEDGVDVVVATPGRALDHLGRGTLHLDQVAMIVLDEADEMLDMGFAEDIESILAAAPVQRQTVLFSATLPPRISGIARHHLRDPIRVQIRGTTTPEGQAPLVRQVAYLVPRSHKASALGRILDVESPTAALVFCRTRDEVDILSETLTARGYRAEALHGGMTQEQRDRVMGRLRAGTADLIVATDVAARGLDVEQLTHVINYDVPSAPESYVHRIGRVGRAGRAGVAITLLEPRQHRLLKTIEKVTGQRITIEKIPTVADLRVRRLEITRSALHETLLEDDAEEFRVVVDTLTDDFDLMEVALAAVKLLHEATGGGPAEEEDIPEVKAARESAGRPPAASGGPRREDRGRGGPTTRIFVGVGRASKIRPQDLVGAIAGETSLGGRQIGAIEIAHKFSIVEIPESSADEVIAALRATKIIGLRAKIDLYHPPGS